MSCANEATNQSHAWIIVAPWKTYEPSEEIAFDPEDSEAKYVMTAILIELIKI